jgi:hypothetical protein
VPLPPSQERLIAADPALVARGIGSRLATTRRPWKEILTMPLLMLKIGFIALAAILAVELGMIAAEWDEQRRPDGWA